MSRLTDLYYLPRQYTGPEPEEKPCDIVQLSIGAGDRDFVLSCDQAEKVWQVTEYRAGDRTASISRVRTNGEASARETFFAMARAKGSTWRILCGPTPSGERAFNNRADTAMRIARMFDAAAAE